MASRGAREKCEDIIRSLHLDTVFHPVSQWMSIAVHGPISEETLPAEEDDGGYDDEGGFCDLLGASASSVWLW